MIQCPECRQMIPDDSAFCDQCGKELKWCPECKKPKRGTECPVCGSDLVPGRKYLAAGVAGEVLPPQAGLTAPPSGAGPLPLHPWADRASGGYSPSAANATGTAIDSEYILEPSREEILATLLPQVMRLRIHTMLLDSIASEHAARMLAMQTASDNAEDLLSELTLEYNKGRQQKITSEILDLVGGAQQ